MEGGGEDVAFTDEDRKVVAGGESFDLRAGVSDAGGTYEDHLEWAAGEFCRLGEDGGVDLAAVGVALDGDVKDSEGFLRRVQHVSCQENCSGAGAEGWRGCDEGFEGSEEAVALEEFEEGSGFAAGDDEAVQIDEFGWGADEFCRRAESSEGFGVGFECALEGEDAYREMFFGHV